jgi:uncharacterized alpha/beta hydrolase family protein
MSFILNLPVKTLYLKFETQFVIKFYFQSTSEQMSEPDLGVKKLQKRLQEKYNVQIGYDTVSHGKEEAMADMYGTW